MMGIKVSSKLNNLALAIEAHNVRMLVVEFLAF